MSPELKFCVQIPALPIVFVEGELTHAFAGELRHAIAQLIEGGHRHIALDMQRVPLADEAGLSALQDAARRLHKLGGNLQLLRPASALVEALESANALGDLRIQPASNYTYCPEPIIEPADVAWEVHRIESTAALLNGAEVRRMVQEAGLAVGFDELTVNDLQLAVGEAVANAVRHGSPDPERSRIAVSCLRARGLLVVEVHDQGHGFDPDAVPLPRTRELQEGGMGIFLMRSLMDAVLYTPTHPGTLVRLFRSLE